MNKMFLQASFGLLFLMGIFLGNSLSLEAHSSLKETFPKGNEVLESSPSTIEVWFQDPVSVHPESIIIIDSAGEQVPVVQSKQDPQNKGHITTKLSKELLPDRYTVKVNVVAQDGFVIDESFHFSVKEATPSKVQELELIQSSVTDGEILQGSPKQIELQFNQPAKVVAFGIFDSNSQSMAIGQPVVNPDNPSHITIPLSETLSAGTYQVTWYAAPDQPEEQLTQTERQGIYYFAVDEFSSLTPINSDAGISVTETLNFSFGLKQLAYWLSFIGLTTLFGMSWFHTVILRKHLQQTAFKKSNLLFYFLGFTGIVLLIIHHRLDLSTLSIKEFLLMKFTLIPVLQLILITIGVSIKGLRPLLYGLALILWPFVTGHASYPRYGGYLTIFIASLHILAVGVWMGGLFSLALKPKQEEQEAWFKRTGPVFSKWAFISIIVIALSGIWMTVRFLPSFSLESLVESEWGASLLIKAVLFLLLLFIGLMQRKAIKKMSSNLIQSFFKRAKIEIVYGVIVFFFAATLVAASPSTAEQGVYSEAGAHQDLDLSVNINPLKVGLNTIELDFQNTTEIKEVTVGLNMPPDWRVEHKAFKVGEGVYKLTGNFLHSAGTIHMKVKVLLKNGEEVEMPYRIVVPGEVRFND